MLLVTEECESPLMLLVMQASNSYRGFESFTGRTPQESAAVIDATSFPVAARIAQFSGRMPLARHLR